MSQEDANKKQKRRYNVVKAFIRLFAIVVKAVPVHFTITAVSAIFHSISFGIITVFTQVLFDNAAAMTTGEKTLGAVIVSVAVLAGAHVISQLLNGFANLQPDIPEKKAQMKITMFIHDKIARIPAEFFEDTEKLDDINKAQKGVEPAVDFVFVIKSVFTFYIPYFIFMGWYLFTLKPILFVSIIVIFIPTMLSQILRSSVFAKLEDASAPVRRENEYYQKCLSDREYFKETRLLGAFSYFSRLFKRTLSDISRLTLRAQIKTDLLALLMSIMSFCGFGLVIYMLFDALMKQDISVGAFAAVYASLNTLFALMDEIIGRHLGRISVNMGLINNLLGFLDLPDRKAGTERMPKTPTITFENVTFKYPQSDTSALDDVSFQIKRGETIAVVGENGSGKTTLCRLITGLYAPVSGRVLYDNIDGADIKSNRLFRNTSGVFQRYQRYQMTLSENISIADKSRKPEPDYLSACMEMSGFQSDDPSFPEGTETMLSREFDGVDISGGQWQRVAIARGYYRGHSLIVLDEPTAAIDPFEESKVYNRFAEMSKSKTALIVTHRLGSVKMADRIFVMAKGKLVGAGNHDELIENCEEYSRMYKSQEQWYK